jgi:hypothetical protein
MHTKLAFALIGTLVLFWSVHPVQAAEPSRAQLLAQITFLQEQIATLQRQLTPVEPAPLANHSVFSDELAVHTTYVLPNTNAVYAIENVAERTYFARILQLFPEPYRSRITELTVFAGADAQYDAYVETIPPRHETWRYGVHEEMLQYPYSESNTELIVHELGHVVSYDRMVGVPQPSAASCHKYFDSGGCPARGSYLGEFIRQFWSTADLDRVTEDDSHNDVARYYRRYQEAFVSEYAAQKPEEDFADSFMFFMLDISVSGETAEEKVRFFENDEEMQRIKAELARLR